MHPTHKPRVYYVATAIIALLVMAVPAMAASFLGQGTVAFDAIRVGKNDKNSQIQLQGPVLNPGTYPDGRQRPVNISDNLVVKGDLMILADKSLKAEGSNSLHIGSPLDVTKAASFRSNVVVAGTFAAATGGFTGNSAVGGNLLVNGTIYNGSVNLSSRTSETRVAANAILDWMSCVQSLAAAAGGPVYSDDLADCWNIWIAGNVADTIP